MSKRIIISRTDSIGDVILTLPVAGLLKEEYPDSHIIFLGRRYTQPIIAACNYVDEFADWDEIAKLSNRAAVQHFRDFRADIIIHVFPNKIIARLAHIARIPVRIATARKLFHLTTANKLLNYSRRKSQLHEAQLNTKLLAPLGFSVPASFEYITGHYGMQKMERLEGKFRVLLADDKFNLVLHPKSKGSAKEWGLKNFAELIERLDENKYNIFITGTDAERELMGDSLPIDKSNVTDLTGQMPLSQLISFISQADGLLAASTGPLHIAAATGIYAIGLFSAKRPIHPGRWAPIGSKSKYLVYDENCPRCRAGKECDCITRIEVSRVVELLDTCKK